MGAIPKSCQFITPKRGKYPFFVSYFMHELHKPEHIFSIFFNSGLLKVPSTNGATGLLYQTSFALVLQRCSMISRARLIEFSPAKSFISGSSQYRFGAQLITGLTQVPLTQSLKGFIMIKWSMKIRLVLTVLIQSRETFQTFPGTFLYNDSYFLRVFSVPFLAISFLSLSAMSKSSFQSKMSAKIEEIQRSTSLWNATP